MDDFSSKDAGDQLDDDITEAIRVSLAEATAPSPHFATKTLNQGKDQESIAHCRILVDLWDLFYNIMPWFDEFFEIGQVIT